MGMYVRACIHLCVCVCMIYAKLGNIKSIIGLGVLGSIKSAMPFIYF